MVNDMYSPAFSNSYFVAEPLLMQQSNHQSSSQKGGVSLPEFSESTLSTASNCSSIYQEDAGLIFAHGGGNASPVKPNVHAGKLGDSELYQSISSLLTAYYTYIRTGEHKRASELFAENGSRFCGIRSDAQHSAKGRETIRRQLDSLSSFRGWTLHPWCTHCIRTGDLVAVNAVVHASHPSQKNNLTIVEILWLNVGNFLESGKLEIDVAQVVVDYDQPAGPTSPSWSESTNESATAPLSFPYLANTPSKSPPEALLNCAFPLNVTLNDVQITDAEQTIRSHDFDSLQFLPRREEREAPWFSPKLGDLDFPPRFVNNELGEQVMGGLGDTSSREFNSLQEVVSALSISPRPPSPALRTTDFCQDSSNSLFQESIPWGAGLFQNGHSLAQSDSRIIATAQSCAVNSQRRNPQSSPSVPPAPAIALQTLPALSRQPQTPQQDWGLRDGEKDRMVYVSWLPRVARAEDVPSKRRKELLAKDTIAKMGFKGLRKVLLYPPASAHCKLLFDSESSARQFLLRYGGRELSRGSELWKRDVCKAYDVSINEGQMGGISSTKVKVIWADERRQEVKAVQPAPPPPQQINYPNPPPAVHHLSHYHIDVTRHCT
eukprot:GHVN01011277.1.p1 GENE.GHVN01011277.1~~GHVN01011277.1.p1  ORF type:complete len:604 (+),score=49.36 GHVN01011277.1:103-1914(+)